MNAKYIAKNPSPVPQTITLPQGLSLDGGRLRSSRAITVQVPPMSVREILFDEDGNPMSEGGIQDLNVTTEHEDGTPIDPHQNRRERTRIVDASGDRTTVFFNEARRIYPTSWSTTTASWAALSCWLNSPICAAPATTPPPSTPPLPST